MAAILSAKLELFYVTVTVTTGLLLIFNDKRPAQNDSGSQWLRAQQVAEGAWLPMRSPSGTDLWGGYADDGVFHAFNNTAVNSPMLYYPSVLASFIKTHDYIVASVMTLICSAVLVAVGIRLAGRSRYVIAAAAFLPTVFFSFTFPTADAVTNSVALLFAAFVLRLWHQSDVAWAQIGILTVLSLAVGFSKSTCVMLLVLIALPAISVYREHRVVDRRLAIPAIAGCAACVLWSWLVRDIPPLLGEDFSIEQYRASKTLLVGHPLDFLRSLAVTLVQPLDFNIKQDPFNVRRNLQMFTGTEDTVLPATVMMFFIVASVLLLIRGNAHAAKLRWPERACVVALLVGFYALTCAAMLLVGDSIFTAARLGTYADGMQSRYFIPILVPLSLLIPNFAIRVRRWRTMNSSIACCLIIGYAGLLCAHIIDFPQV